MAKKWPNFGSVAKFVACGQKIFLVAKHNEKWPKKRNLATKVAKRQRNLPDKENEKELPEGNISNDSKKEKSNGSLFKFTPKNEY